jgi:hypothetical protein
VRRVEASSWASACGDGGHSHEGLVQETQAYESQRCPHAR